VEEFTESVSFHQRLYAHAMARSIAHVRMLGFDAFDAVRASLELAAPLGAGAELNRAAIADRLDKGYLDATTLMEYLIRQGIPQRTAQGAVGRLVRRVMDRGVRLMDVSLHEFREEEPQWDEGVYQALGVYKAVEAMASYGATGSSQVRQQMERWKARLGETGETAWAPKTRQTDA
jgi:argininosuccinate lyase